MGIKGSDGPQGLQGELGPMGPKGTTGGDGTKGETGPPGKLKSKQKINGFYHQNQFKVNLAHLIHPPKLHFFPPSFCLETNSH
jgi:hypothetical protein